MSHRPSNEMPVIMAASDILLSAWRDPLIKNRSIKMLVYLSAKRPVVASNLASYTQTLNENIAYLTEPTPVSFANTIEKVINNKDDTDKKVHTGYELAKSNHTYAAFKKQLQSIYGQVER